MPAQPNQIDLLDPAVLSQLACPACLGGLRLEEARLVCAGCAEDGEEPADVMAWPHAF